MKKVLFSVLFILTAIQTYSQIIPHVEYDYVSTVTGKNYSGIIIRNDSDTVTVKISNRKFNLVKSQIDIMEKRVLEIPFIPNSQYSEIRLANLEAIQGNILEYNYMENIRFIDTKSQKVYDLKWNQFIDLKTMDPDYLNYDIIFPIYGDQVKGTFVSITDKQGFVFENEDGMRREYLFQSIRKIYLRNPGKFQLPDKFQNTYTEQKPVKPFVTIGAGVSLPIGEYEDKVTKSKAAIGFNINADINVPLSNYFLLDFSLSYQSLSNEIEKQGFLDQVETKNWSNIWVLAGPMFMRNTEQSAAFISLQGGVLLASFPEITYSSTTSSNSKPEIISGEADGVFAYAIGAGFGTEKFLFTIKYLSAKPEFTISNSKFSGTGKADIDVSAITVGIGFRF